MESTYTYASTWYLSIIPLGVSVAFHLFASFRIKRACDYVDECISSYDDLFYVRDAINTSMTLAIYYLAFFLVLIAVLGYFVTARGMGVGLAMNHLFIFGVFSIIPALGTKHFEKKIRRLAVDAEDPNIEATFKSWLAQWGKAQFRLKDDDITSH